MDYLDNYKYKILDRSALKKVIEKNSKKTFVMCHGVFDIVHPGHLRHLANAKSKADFLIVSITTDRHIKKGTYRPHIPEKLRALNLSALDMVDYVIIDSDATPINNIKYLKPNFFAKGFEYQRPSFQTATYKEAQVVKSYGGKVLFTPGDVVYSSSKILEKNLPNLKYEKLINLFKINDITFNEIYELLKKIKNVRVHVVGDMIVDTYTYGDFIGGQTKTPTFSIKYLRHKHYTGGAGIVAKHLAKSGAKVTLTTMVGKDHLSEFVKKDLKKHNIKLNFIIDKNRPTTNKNAIISSSYRLLKLDTVDNSPISLEMVAKFRNFIKNTKADVIIFSDYRHGIFNFLSIKELVGAIPKKILKIVDSQVASRWGNITDFKKFDLITPNEREARFATSDQDSSVGSLASLVIDKSNAKNIILKLGNKGVLCLKNKTKKYFSIDSFAEKIIDPVGSGDALLSYAATIFFLSRSLEISSFIGSVAAACVCEKEGNEPVLVSDLIDKLEYIKKQIEN